MNNQTSKTTSGSGGNQASGRLQHGGVGIRDEGLGALSQSRAGEQLYGFMSRDPPERWPRQGGFDQSLWQPGGALELGGNGLAADGLATPLWHMAFDDLRAVECEPGGEVSFCEPIGGPGLTKRAERDFVQEVAENDGKVCPSRTAESPVSHRLVGR